VHPDKIGCSLREAFAARRDDMSSTEPRRIFVTGGNDGIGYALCRQLVVEHGCQVFLGSRSEERGRAAAAKIEREIDAAAGGSVQCVLLDVCDAASVASAAHRIRVSLGDAGRLYGLVNNAGVGLATALTPEKVLDTNLYGVKRVFEAFVGSGLVEERVVNVGSGSGPGYVRRCPAAAQPALCTTPTSWESIESMIAPSADGRTGLRSAADTNGAYGLSKAMLTLYTMLCADSHPDLLISCVSPGWIRTKLVGHDGPSKGPEEGTASILHALFAPLEASGWYYGSDCLRSPLHFMRNPGEPPYDGVVEGVVGVE
jgi:NAD(P)-dependent dehydrogenase (short-subunit alcohol dehydrogenase family)